MQKNIRVLVALGIVLCLTLVSNAHPFYNTQTYGPVELTWNNTYASGIYHLEVNGDSLSTLHSNYYVASSESWLNVDNTNYIRVDTEEPFSSSTVDFCTPSSTWWQNNYGADNPYAVTILTTTDNVTIENDTSYLILHNSSCKVDYAQIYIRPTLTSVNQIKKSMTHEVGHVWGLGHTDRDIDGLPYATPSIMRSGAYISYWEPQEHDFEDLEDKYS